MEERNDVRSLRIHIKFLTSEVRRLEEENKHLRKDIAEMRENIRSFMLWVAKEEE
jgi:predicted RNase H-like nuclease (RuvC/YqgF family)